MVLAKDSRSRKYLSYLTDNPFRLLNVASSTLYVELRQKANSVKHRVNACLAVTVGLEATFGSEYLERSADIVRDLANDPKRRTLYRLFWPFDYVPSSGANGSDIPLLTGVRPSTRFAQDQMAFLSAWYEFLIQSNPNKLRDAISSFNDFCYNPGCGDYLLDLLSKEGESSGRSLIDEAQSIAARHILLTGCASAAAYWEIGSIPSMAAILDVVFSSEFDDDLIDRALIDEIRPLGDRENSKVKALIDSFDGWSPSNTITEPDKEVEKLRSLALVVRERMSADADHWLQTVQQRVDQVASAMRSYAVDIANNSNDYDSARRILRQIESMPVSDSIREQVKMDLTTVDNLLRASVLANKSNSRSSGLSARCMIYIVLIAISGIVGLCGLVSDGIKGAVLSKQFGSDFRQYISLAAPEGLRKCTAIHGKILPLDIQTGRIDAKVLDSLPLGLKATSRKDIDTVLLLSWGYEHACWYTLSSTEKVEGLKQVCNAKIINVRDKGIVDSHRFTAPDPPSTISRTVDSTSAEQSDISGDVIAQYIVGLPSGPDNPMLQLGSPPTVKPPLIRSSRQEGKTKDQNGISDLPMVRNTTQSNERSELLSKATRLSNSIQSAKAELDTMKGQVESESQGLGVSSAALDSDRIMLDRTDQSAVDRFNANVRSYNVSVQLHKRSLRDYNKKVDAYNSLLRDLRSIHSRLNNMGGGE